MKHWQIYLYLLLLGVSACATRTEIESNSYTGLYDYESRIIHPEFIVYHTSADSSELYFKIMSSELLYSRTTAESPFEAQVKMTVVIWEEGQTSRANIIDSLSFSFVESNPDVNEREILGKYLIPLNEGKNYDILVAISDLKRKYVEYREFSVNKSNPLDGSNVLLKRAIDNRPIFGNKVITGTEILMETRSEKNEAFYLVTMQEPSPLPPPPFSSNQPELLDLSQGKITKVEANEGVYSFTASGTFFFLSPDRLLENGTPCVVHNPYFPDVADIANLGYTLRYITSKNEYNDIVNSNYSKKKIDEFWLDCGGSKDRARELIRTYYNRVRESNHFFTSYTEGWKTDRGLIQIVFGQPKRITITDFGEEWLYGEDGNASSLRFKFDKVETNLSNNHYVLRRDQNLKNDWERLVVSWRNGKIYSD